MEQHVYPNERALMAEDERADALIVELQQEARDAGLWAPHLPPEAGGSGSGFIEYAYLNEEIGRSFIAQLIFGCQAPDAGITTVRTARAVKPTLKPNSLHKTRSGSIRAQAKANFSGPNTSLNPRSHRSRRRWGRFRSAGQLQQRPAALEGELEQHDGWFYAPDTGSTTEIPGLPKAARAATSTAASSPPPGSAEHPHAQHRPRPSRRRSPTVDALQRKAAAAAGASNGLRTRAS
jgi:hypothetical protein